jgi:hypothetical protein
MLAGAPQIALRILHALADQPALELSHGCENRHDQLVDSIAVTSPRSSSHNAMRR